MMDSYSCNQNADENVHTFVKIIKCGSTHDGWQYFF